MSDKTLAHRMRDKALQVRRLDWQLSDRLLEHANALEALDVTTPIPKLVGTWAKARKFWCDLTGEDLV